MLHLKSGVTYLSEKTLVITDALANREEFHEYYLIRSEPGEAYAANCIELNGRVLIAAGHPHFEKKLRDLGYETIELEMSEFRKMDGRVKLFVDQMAENRQQFSPANEHRLSNWT